MFACPEKTDARLPTVGTSLLQVTGLGDDVTRGRRNPLWFGLTARLKTARDAANLNRRAVEVSAELARGSMTRIEDGLTIPAVDTLEKIADALGVPASWLAYGYDGENVFRQRRSSHVTNDDPPEVGNVATQQQHRGIAHRAHHARQIRGHSLRGIAGAAGISAQSLMLTEAGETIPLVSTCEALAVALDVAPSWLAFGVGVGPEDHDAHA